MRADVRECAVLRLLALRDRDEFRAEQVQFVSEQLGVAERTVWRWLQMAHVEGRTARKPRPRLEVTDGDLVELAYHHGSVAAFHRERRKAGPTPGLGAWRRAFERDLSPGRWAGLARGERARRDHDTYLARQPQFRNECWEADHCELAIEVLLPDRRVVKPWLTHFVDQYSKAIMGFAIAETPSQESVLAALRSAILVDEPYGPFGGVPFAIRFDRGKEFLAEAVKTAAGALAIDARPLRAYSPHLKGTCERTNETIEQLFLAELPGFTHGPRDRKGHVVDPTAPLLPLERFVELFVEFVTKNNTERPHEGLDGRTPLQQWEGDPTPLHLVAPDRVRHLMLARTTRTVTKEGIRLNGRRYNHEELCGWRGERLEVRHMPHHHEEVDVFVDGRHLCTAKLVDRLSPAEARRLVERHAEEARWLSRQLRAANKKRRVRYAAMTEPRPPVPVTAFTESAGAAELAAYADTDRRRRASRSLVAHGPVPARMVRPVVVRSDAS